MLLLADRWPLLMVGAGIAVSIAAGRYRGLRLSELVRFRPVARSGSWAARATVSGR